ncbi:BQ2448_2892 [Microbotryum intermedium]|uniref:BQ2448_2892 protein n=1 Tax=Microbotryum intermedium TaxID=269621 RepID=A0A238FHD7_9BASI|nr:BQ2448_2892 [Microbotryum intermedium]
MANDRNTSCAVGEDSTTLLRNNDSSRAKLPKSPPLNPFHATAALTSLKARLEEFEARRLDSEERICQLEKMVEDLLKDSAEPAAAKVGEFMLVRLVPLDVPPLTLLGHSGNTADPLDCTPGGESHSVLRVGPSPAVISSRWRGTLPDREGLWTGDHPERLVTFTAFGELYLSLLCDILTADLFTTNRVVQLVATLFARTTSCQRLREGRPYCWTSLMTAVGRCWPDPGFAHWVAQDFYGCRQSVSWAYDHVGEWRACYCTFMHNNSSFGLSALQLAMAFYQSLNDASK